MMNCSAISVARTATNGCTSAALNGAFLATAPAIAAATITATTSGTSAKSVLSASNNNITTTSTKTYSTASINGNGCNLNQTVGSSQSPTKTKNVQLAAKIIQQSHIVCFDVDSTVIREEGIDELADFCGKGSEVARVTKEAMGGAMTFQDALKIRLNIIRPTQQQIAEFVKLRPATLTRNVRAFIEHLRAEGKQVYLISGGFDCLIEPVAQELGICAATHLFANKLMFYYNGDYASFDTTQPTARSGGKAEAIARIKQQNPETALITMIGDGATDLEAVPPANHFIGFGGNVVRAEVFNRAQYYVTDFEQLM